MILERAVFERSLHFSSYQMFLCVRGELSCERLNESKRRERTKAQVQMQHFSFIFYFIHISFDFFAFASWFSQRFYLFIFKCLDAQTCFSSILLNGTHPGESITVFALLKRTQLMSKTTWKDLRKVLDSHCSSMLSACSWIYWFSRFMECGGMCCSAHQLESWPLLSFCWPFLLE